MHNQRTTHNVVLKISFFRVAAVAAIKACELSKLLRRATHHYREVDTLEGKKFLSQFPRGFVRSAAELFVCL